MLIETAGWHDIPETDYHADPLAIPSLSASIASTLLSRSPKHAWMQHPRLNTAAGAVTRTDFDIGSAAHALLLRGVDDFDVIDVANYQTKAAKQQRDAAHAASRIPLKRADWERVQAMVAAARRQIERHRDVADCLARGVPESTAVWREGPVWCRAMMDLTDQQAVAWDYKTTSGSAHADTWVRTMYNTGKDVQEAFYRRGLNALGADDPQFYFLVQEIEPPYALNVIALDAQARALGDAKVALAIERWAWCQAHDRWPGYPKRTCWVCAPVWEARKVVDEHVRREVADDADFRAAIAFQAPITKAAQ